MDACLDYIESLDGAQRRIMLTLFQFIGAFPQVTCRIRYRVPFFHRKSPICYLNPLKNGGVELCFVRASELSNEQGLLDFKDRTQVAGVTYFSTNDIRESVLAEVLQEALLLDEEAAEAAKRKRGRSYWKTTIWLSILLHFSFFIPLYPTLLQAQGLPARRTPLPESIREVSGMARTPEGYLWMLNDSRNPSELFLFDPVANQLLETRTLPVPNRDWEDLTLAPDGHLYIGDFGNNRNARRDLCIFRYHPQTQVLDSILFHYPDQQSFPPADDRDWNFNCEAVVFFQDSLHLFSKVVFKGNFVTKHYVLPARPGRYVAKLRDSIVLKNRVVTGAALSPDGKTLAITSYIVGKKLGFIPYTRATAYFFTDFSGSRFLQGKRRSKRLPKCIFARQFESITWWDDNTWLVANEGRPSQRQAVWLLKKG